MIEDYFLGDETFLMNQANAGEFVGAANVSPLKPTTMLISDPIGQWPKLRSLQCNPQRRVQQYADLRRQMFICKH
jgi:hypothetical protein